MPVFCCCFYPLFSWLIRMLISSYKHVQEWHYQLGLGWWGVVVVVVVGAVTVSFLLLH